MRKQFEELHPLFDLEKDEQGEYTCVLTRVTWLGFELGKKTLQAEIEQLKTQLNNMESCYIQKKKEYEGLQDRVEGVLGKMLTKAESLQQGCDGYIDPVELCQAEGIEMCMRFLEKALRGEHENSN